MNGVVLRRARDEDLDALYMIDKVCFPRHHFSKYFIRLLLEYPSSVAIVAMISSRIVGFTIGVIEDENESRIYTIGVLPDFRRRGIGRLLLEKLEEELARQGAVKCRLEVMEGNIPALQLYSKMGYHRLGVIRRYYGDKDGIVMEKVLKPLRTA
ncbi:MAG: GNAT family N-acetyltransferase [Candidatus Jordarchaeales archaeon]|nr:GNAT family N-acetyltransferase [Candidatus Jordarchaeia archaeon]